MPAGVNFTRKSLLVSDSVVSYERFCPPLLQEVWRGQIVTGASDPNDPSGGEMGGGGGEGGVQLVAAAFGRVLTMAN